MEKRSIRYLQSTRHVNAGTLLDYTLTSSNMAQREFEQRQGALNNCNVFDISFQEKDGVWEIRHEW